MSRNITLSNGSFQFDNSYKFPGLSFYVPNKFVRKYFGFINRVSSTKVTFPMKVVGDDSVMLKKNRYETTAIDMIKSHAPNFIPLKSPIKLKA